jgi:hypothetical protein
VALGAEAGMAACRGRGQDPGAEIPARVPASEVKAACRWEPVTLAAPPGSGSKDPGPPTLGREGGRWCGRRPGCPRTLQGFRPMARLPSL